MLCFAVYFTSVNVTSVSVKQSFKNSNSKTKPCVKNKMLALSCQEINQFVSCVRFFTSREGVVGVLPNFLGSVYGRAVAHGHSSATRTCALAITSGFSILFNLCWFTALRIFCDLWILLSSGHHFHLGFVTVIFSSVHATATFLSSALQVFAVRVTPVPLCVGWWWYCSGFVFSHFLLPVHT